MLRHRFDPGEFQRILLKNGWSPVRQRGSHRIRKRGSDTLYVPIATLKPCISAKLIKEFGLAV